MDLKDIVEAVLDHARECLVFILLLGILCGIFYEGGMKNIIELFGISMFGR